MADEEKNLGTVLRHVLDKTNWSGDPHSRDEAYAALGELFPDKDDDDNDDGMNDGPSGWSRGDAPVHTTSTGVRVYAINKPSGGVEYVSADDGGWRDGTFTTIEAAVKDSEEPTKDHGNAPQPTSGARSGSTRGKPTR